MLLTEITPKTHTMDLADLSYEQLAAALYHKGEREGFQKVTDKTKWREPVMAEKLGHVAHDKISAGADSEKYGSDAFDASTNRFAEYKSNAVDQNWIDIAFNNKKQRNGKSYKARNVCGVYNGAYKDSAIEAYSNIDHYFGVFYKEQCVLIIKAHTEEVIRQLVDNNNNRKPGATTNLNTVTINLDDVHKYEIAYKRKFDV